MDDAHTKAAKTRQTNQEARLNLLREQVTTTRTARLALQRVFENPDATPSEILEAAVLLVEIGKR